MICQIRPRMRCSRPSAISEDPILTTEQPIALADVTTMLLFSVIWKALSGLRGVGLFRTRPSIVSGTESLIKFTEDQAIFAVIKELHGVCWDFLEFAVGIIDEDLHQYSVIGCCDQVGASYRIYVLCKLPTLILVDGMAHVCIGALDRDFACSRR
jgi:hypothetical protein